jgi:hypothetical protein
LLQQAIDQRGLAVVDVGDDGDVAKFHGSSSGRAILESAITPENRDPPFPDRTHKLWSSKGAQRAQKGSPAKRTGHTLLVAAQYSQESAENNALFAIWLADFCPRPASGATGLFGGINAP